MITVTEEAKELFLNVRLSGRHGAPVGSGGGPKHW
jgi:hypothetical protein